MLLQLSEDLLSHLLLGRGWVMEKEKDKLKADLLTTTGVKGHCDLVQEGNIELLGEVQ